MEDTVEKIAFFGEFCSQNQSSFYGFVRSEFDGKDRVDFVGEGVDVEFVDGAIVEDGEGEETGEEVDFICKELVEFGVECSPNGVCETTIVVCQLFVSIHPHSIIVIGIGIIFEVALCFNFGSECSLPFFLVIGVVNVVRQIFAVFRKSFVVFFTPNVVGGVEFVGEKWFRRLRVGRGIGTARAAFVIVASVIIVIREVEATAGGVRDEGLLGEADGEKGGAPRAEAERLSANLR